MAKRYLLIGIGLFTLTLAAAAACSLRYDFTECSSDADCQAFNDPPTFYQCTDNNTCQELEDVECQNDSHCNNGSCNGGVCEVTDTGMPSETGDTADAGDTGGDTVMKDVDTGPDRNCDTTTHCFENFGENYICAPEPGCKEVDGNVCEPSVCRKATQENGPCTELIYPDSDVDREKVVILGSIIPQSGLFKTVGDVLSNAVEMAMREFYTARSTLKGQTIALVQCDSGGRSSTAEQAAEHLVSIGAPAIVGPVRSGSYLSVVGNVTGVDESQVLSIAPAATAPGIRNLKSAGDYSFRIIGNDRYQAQALLDRLKILLESRPNAEIVVFYKEDTYGTGLQSEFLTDVDQASWIDSSRVHYKEIFDPLEHSEQALKGNLSTKASEAVSEHPDAPMIVFLGTGEMIQLAATYIQTAAGSGVEPEAKRYIFSHGAVSDLPGLPVAISGGGDPNETFVPLSEGITPNVIERNNFGPFNTRYNNIFGKELTASAAGVAYDSALLATLAMAGVPEGDPTTGSTVRNVIKNGRLQDEEAKKIQFDAPSKFATAKSNLRDGGTIDVVGVSGPLDFDKQGDVLPDYLGTDTGIKFDSLSGNIEYDINPTRVWSVADDSVAGNWGGIPAGLLTSKGTIKSVSPATTIPDNDTSGLTSTFSVGSNECSNVIVAKITVDVDHPAPEELRVEIESPATQNGSPVTATLRQPGWTSRPLKGSFPTTLIPTPGSNFDDLLGAKGEGDWKLTITDTSAANGSGTLQNWTLRLDCN